MSSSQDFTQKRYVTWIYGKTIYAYAVTVLLTYCIADPSNFCISIWACAMSCNAAWISFKVASPCLTTSSNLLAASRFSSSSFCKLALCSSIEDSSLGKDSINTSISLAVLAISWAKSCVWSSFCCCCGVLLPNPGNWDGTASCCSMPRLLVKLSACYKKV